MAKLILDPITNFTSGSASATYETNNDRIEAALEKTFSRDGTSPNTMEANLDMNSNRIVNLPDAVLPSEPIRLSQLEDLITADPDLKGDPGEPGPPGEPGEQGPQGDPGPAGDSVIWIVASGVPGGGTGNDGDMYLNSGTGDLYGPKAGGAWGSIVANIKGPQGAAGAGTGDMLAANNLSDVASAATAFSNIKQNATESATGVAELATQAEVSAGSAGDLVVTAAKGAVAYGRLATAGTWSADQTGSGWLVDANGHFKIVSSNTRLTMDSGDYLEYDRTNNRFNFFIGSTQELRISSTGIDANAFFVDGANISTLYQPLDADLTAVAGLNSNGLVTRTSNGNMSARTITGSSSITVTNGDGVSGNPTLRVTAIPLGGAASDETTALVAGTAKLTFRMPYAFTLTAVRASLTTAQTSGNIVTVDINESGTTILSTKLTIDNNEKTSTTAAAAAVISDTSLADDAEITIDIDQVGNGTATGLKIWLIGYPT